MSDEDKTKQMRRLIDAALSARLIKGEYPLTELAALLGDSPQTLKNWYSRGVSSQGLIRIQEVMKISADYIRNGSLPVMSAAHDQPSNDRPVMTSARSAADAWKAADAVRSVLVLGGFSPDQLGTREEIICRLMSDQLHTENEDDVIRAKEERQQNDVQLPNGTGHGAFFEPAPGEQKKSPKHSKGEG